MLSFTDVASIAAISLACAAVVGVLGLIAMRVARRSITSQLVILAVVGALSVAAGTVVVASAMYLSEHDLGVLLTVTMTSTVASAAVIVVTGRLYARESARLHDLVASVRTGERVEHEPGAQGGSDLARLGDELAQTTRDLADARAETTAMDASRRTLVSWISHDLRTPLAGLRAMSEALEDGMVADPDRFHRQMRSQVDRLSIMVDDLFVLSRIHAESFTLNVEELSLVDLVSDSVAGLGPLAESRSVELRLRTANDQTIRGDARELGRVVDNLLTNAIQHSPAHTVITIDIERDPASGAVLAIADQGGGIPESDLANVFETGWRASRARSPQPQLGHTGGAGLGLAIVRGIVEAHDGLVSVTNISGGCRFEVQLPAAQSAA